MSEQKYPHPRLNGDIVMLPWPRGSRAANRYWQQQRERKNKHPGESFKTLEPQSKLARKCRRLKQWPSQFGGYTPQ